jgi:hypothetical protein
MEKGRHLAPAFFTACSPGEPNAPQTLEPPMVRRPAARGDPAVSVRLRMTQKSSQKGMFFPASKLCCGAAPPFVHLPFRLKSAFVSST